MYATFQEQRTSQLEHADRLAGCQKSFHHPVGLKSARDLFLLRGIKGCVRFGGYTTQRAVEYMGAICG